MELLSGTKIMGSMSMKATPMRFGFARSSQGKYLAFAGLLARRRLLLSFFSPLISFRPCVPGRENNQVPMYKLAYTLIETTKE